MTEDFPEGTGRDKDDPRYPLDYTEWWKCCSCRREWYVPEDYAERLDQCPGCGHGEHELVDSIEVDDD